MTRNEFIKQAGLVATGLVTDTISFGRASDDFPVVRTQPDKRRFHSKSVEAAIAEFKKNAKNRELAWLFENCFPNTLDTTVEFENKGGQPDTYVITGDIDAMWLRDSSAQVWPYLQFIKNDKELQQLI